MVKKAYLLVGGEGTRLRPLTLKTPKALIQVKGKPMIEHIIDHLAGHGIEEFYLSVGYLREKIMDYFGDGSSKGVGIEYVVEEERLGTAGGLNLAKDQLTERFVMMNGDVLSRVDLGALEKFHEKMGGLGSLTLREVPDARTYGAMEMDGDKILDFVEKSENPPSNLINAGFYLLEPEVFNYVPKEGFSMVERDVFPQMAKGGKLFGYVYSGPWMDIGTPERLDEANRLWE